MHRSRRTRYWPYVLVKCKGSGWLHKGKETIMSKRFRGVLWLALGIGLLLGASPRASHAQESRTEEGVGLTIYSESTQQRVPGWGVIKEWRKIVLKKGRNEYRFRDVASQIDGTTVHFKSLTDPAGTTSWSRISNTTWSARTGSCPDTSTSPSPSCQKKACPSGANS
jgi:hypothetical protein